MQENDRAKRRLALLILRHIERGEHDPERLALPRPCWISLAMIPFVMNGGMSALSGHANRSRECPLLGVKRTSRGHDVLSANDQSGPETLALQELLLFLDIENVQHRAFRCRGAGTLGNRLCQQPF